MYVCNSKNLKFKININNNLQFINEGVIKQIKNVQFFITKFFSTHFLHTNVSLLPRRYVLAFEAALACSLIGKCHSFHKRKISN